MVAAADNGKEASTLTGVSIGHIVRGHAVSPTRMHGLWNMATLTATQEQLVVHGVPVPD